MSAPQPPDVFSSLAEAVIRGARNYHRLEQLGRYRDRFTLHEETITDLLLAEMAGREYTVDAACPGSDATYRTTPPDRSCAPGGPCVHWNGNGLNARAGVSVRALTKKQEGGNGTVDQPGVHADFVLAVKNYDPDQPDENHPTANQVRIVVQAKRVNPTDTSFLRASSQREQYGRLIAAADTLGACPYYALYVQQPTPHDRTATRCRHLQNAADCAVVLVPAHSSGGATGDLPGLPGLSGHQVIALGRPLRCLGGCACTGVRAGATIWDTVLAFLHSDFPDYEPAPQVPLSDDITVLEQNAAYFKPRPTRRLDTGDALKSRSADASPREDILVVRLGERIPWPGPSRAYMGYAPDMAAADLRDAARMYWRLNPTRAQALRHLVAASIVERRAVEAYDIAPDGLAFTRVNGTQKAVFQISEVEDPDRRQQLLALSDSALTKTQRNPVMYLQGPGS